jgi:hypothetical protein
MAMDFLDLESVPSLLQRSGALAMAGITADWTFRLASVSPGSRWVSIRSPHRQLLGLSASIAYRLLWLLLQGC